MRKFPDNQHKNGRRANFDNMQQEIRRQRDMLTSIIESMTHPFFVVDVKDLSVIVANSTAYEMAANFEDIRCYALLRGGHKRCGMKDHPCPVDSVINTKKPVVIEHLCRDNNGQAKHVEVHSYPVFNESGDVTAVIEYWLDVTERKQAQQHMENLAKFLSENPNPVIRIRSDGTILYANSAGRTLLEDWGCEVGVHAPQKWRQYVTRIHQSGKSEEVQVASGNVIYDLTVAPVADADYVNVYGIDITQRNKAEEALRSYREHLEELVQERTEELTRTNELLVQEIEQRKNLEREILNISEQEQRRIGQELHDSLGQQLTGIAFMTRVLAQKLEKKSISEADDVAKISKLVNDAITQARGLARGLHPVDLDSGSLIGSLQEFASSTQRLFGIKCNFQYDRDVEVKETEKAVHIYRIVQEAVTNAIRHGNAKKIDIKLTGSDGKYTLVVENDGKDFPRKFEKRGTGIGLQIMDHRVDLIAGKLTIHKGSQGGAIVTCTFEA